jgi:hypothetical protein
MRLSTVASILFLTSFCSWAGGLSIGNYSFEDPNLESGYQYRPNQLGVDWSFQGSAGIAANLSAFDVDYALETPPYDNPAPSGNQVGFLQWNSNNPSSLPGTISQTITGFIEGQSYVVSFEAANRPDVGDPYVYGGEQDFNVYWDGQLIDYIDGATDLNADDTFALFMTTPFIASASDAANGGVLEFQVTGLVTGDHTDFIDNIEVNDPALPEPSTWLLMLSGILLFGFGLRRRLIRSL